MRVVSFFAGLVSMIGVLIMAAHLSGGTIDWRSILVQPSGSYQASKANAATHECTMLGVHAASFSCEVVGNPNATRWPEATAEHSFARSVWDMEIATIGSRGERIYFGGGDWGLNQGPVPIWSLFLHSLENGERVSRVVAEQPVFGEAVEFLREIEGQLYIPDIDPSDPWSLGNIYALGAEGWFKYRSLDNAVHVFDVIGFQGVLVASAGVVENDTGLAGLFTSADQGVSWARVPASEAEAKKSYRFWRMAEFGDRLFIGKANARSGYWTLDPNWVLESHDTDLFPDMLDADLRLTVSRAEKFGDSILYLPGLERLPVRKDLLEAPLAPVYQSNEHFVAWWEKLRAAWPLMHRDLHRLSGDGDVSVVALPGDPEVNDITVIADTVFVLGVSFDEGFYEAIILSSDDLREWSEVHRVETSGIAYSFEQLGGEWFLGLAADGMSDTNGASGEILRIRARK